MGFHQRKRLQLPGLAEVIAVLLTMATVVPAALWLRSVSAGNWELAEGVLLRAHVRHTHYNAEGTRAKVLCDFEYVVGQTRYHGSWAGFWPGARSPNALGRDELSVLKPGYPLLVYFRASDPRVSNPHAPDDHRPVLYAWLFATACLVTGYYFFRIYPVLRMP